MSAGLRLDQGPPFAVPMAFFLTAPWFLAASGLVAALTWESWSASRWTPASLALTHLLGIGHLGLCMLGALTQMAPVAAGGALPGVIVLGRFGLVLLATGIPLLAWGLAGHQATLAVGAPTSALALAVFALTGLAALARAPAGATRQAMRFALAALLGAVVLGLALAAWLGGVWPEAPVARLVDAHAGLALAGWIGLLVAGSAYQVVPMLQITPTYPSWFTRAFAPALAAVLVLWCATRLVAHGAEATPGHLPDLAGDLLASLLALGCMVFATITLWLLGRRRRRLGDTTLHAWRLGMLCLAGTGLALLGSTWLPASARAADRLALLAGLLFLPGFALTVVNGMLLKIVPFLAWFHLQAQLGARAMPATGMQGFIPETRARRQFRLHGAALACLLACPWLPELAVPGSLLLIASALYLAAYLGDAGRRFRALGGTFGAGRIA